MVIAKKWLIVALLLQGGVSFSQSNDSTVIANILEEETKRLIQTYQDADPLRARMYVAHMLVNEEIFKFLEAQK